MNIKVNYDKSNLTPEYINEICELIPRIRCIITCNNFTEYEITIDNNNTATLKHKLVCVKHKDTKVQYSDGIFYFQQVGINRASSINNHDYFINCINCLKKISINITKIDEDYNRWTERQFSLLCTDCEKIKHRNVKGIFDW